MGHDIEAQQLSPERRSDTVPMNMKCACCGSDREREFKGEVAIHFPGPENLDKPIVWVFPQLLVCLGCGVAQFAVPKAELSVLAEDDSHSAPAR